MQPTDMRSNHSTRWVPTPVAPVEVDETEATEAFTTRLDEQGGPFQSVEDAFIRCHLDATREGVIFLDAGYRVKYWNRTAEQITGIRAGSVHKREWLPSSIGLNDRYGSAISDQQCPVREAVAQSEPRLTAASLIGRGGRKVFIDLHAVPIIGTLGEVHGIVVLLHDLTSQVELEQQVLTLYAHATRDHLTGVANRTHFERTLESRIAEFQNTNTPGCLIITDIDYFKIINDEFGHHVGDQALMAFAKLIQQNTSVDDIVARIGGEEFVILCPNSRIDEAAARADEVRQALQATPLAVLEGKCLTASFGVSQIQPHDTSTTVFVRADQALLRAKEEGRNRVVKCSESQAMPVSDRSPSTQPDPQGIPWRQFEGHILCCEEMSTSSTMDVVIEKFKGFVSEVQGQILKAEEEYLQLRVAKVPGEKARRFGDRSTPLLVDIELHHSRNIVSQETTLIRVTIRPGRARDRRQRNLADRAQLVVRELRSYLMVGPRDSLPSSLRPAADNSRY